MFCQELAVVGQSRQPLRLDLLQDVGERHVAEAMMMAVAFAVGGDVHELRPISFAAKAPVNLLDETIAVRKQSLEGDGARDRAVVKKQRDGSPRRQTLLIGACRIDGPRR